MPLHGFTRMFENMLDHENITLQLGTDYRDVKDSVPYREMIYTGPIDEFFDFRFGPLPYRSLEFRHETHDKEVFQAAPVVNYPGPERPAHARDRIQIPDRTEAPQDQRCLRISEIGRRSVLSRFRARKTRRRMRNTRHW